MLYEKSEAKEWARGVYKGLDATILPSFKSDTLALDEAGIRHDLRQIIRQGFFSTTTVTAEAGTTKEEDKRFVEWCVDEAKGRVGVTMSLRYYTVADNIEMARFAQAVGCHSVMISYPPNFHPRSEQEIHDYTKRICDAIDIGVVLFPSVKNDFPPPYRVSVQTLDRLADLANVIALKIGVLEWMWIDECFRRLGDRLLVSYPFDDAWPTFIRHYGMRWSGSAPWHNFQTAEDPREIRLFNLIREGKMDDATELYWRTDPLRKAVLSIAIPTANMGLYNFEQWKYCEGLLGMTGGEMRMPKLALFSWQKDQLRNAMLASGLKPVK